MAEMEYLPGGIKERLEDLRNRRKLTLKEVAEKTGIDYSTLSRIEKSFRSFSLIFPVNCTSAFTQAAFFSKLQICCFGHRVREHVRMCAKAEVGTA